MSDAFRTPGSRLVECPSGFAFKPRKFTGLALAAISAKAEMDDLSTLIASCCVGVEDPGPYAIGKDGQPNWKRVISGDLAVALVRIRAISIPPSHDGELFRWRIKCPNEECKEERVDPRTREVRRVRREFFWEVRLCDLPIIPLSDEARALVKAGNDAFPGTLLDGRAFTFKLPSDEDGPVVRKLLRENAIQLRDVDADAASQVLMPFFTAAAVTSIEGVPRDRVPTEVLDLDPWSQANIREQISARDGGFDRFKGRCDACDTEFDLALPIQPRLLLSLESTQRRANSGSSAGPGASSTTASPG